MLYNQSGKKKKYRTIFDFEPRLYRKWLNFLDDVLWDLGPAIFSIHLGKYQSADAPNFHAHFFIPVKIYVSMAVKHSAPININLPGWQKKALKEGKQYKSADLRNIFRQEPFTRSFPRLPYGYKIRFHSTQPRIAFYREKGIEQIPEIIQAMTTFVKYYNLHLRKKGGSHMVIQHGLHIDNEFKTYMAYLQVDIINFYRIHPRRKQWLKRFKKDNYVVLT